MASFESERNKAACEAVNMASHTPELPSAKNCGAAAPQCIWQKRGVVRFANDGTEQAINLLPGGILNIVVDTCRYRGDAGKHPEAAAACAGVPFPSEESCAAAMQTCVLMPRDGERAPFCRYTGSKGPKSKEAKDCEWWDGLEEGRHPSWNECAAAVASLQGSYSNVLKWSSWAGAPAVCARYSSADAFNNDVYCGTRMVYDSSSQNDPYGTFYPICKVDDRPGWKFISTSRGVCADFLTHPRPFELPDVEPVATLQECKDLCEGRLDCDLVEFVRSPVYSSGLCKINPRRLVSCTPNHRPKDAKHSFLLQLYRNGFQTPQGQALASCDRVSLQAVFGDKDDPTNTRYDSRSAYVEVSGITEAGYGISTRVDRRRDAEFKICIWSNLKESDCRCSIPIVSSDSVYLQTVTHGQQYVEVSGRVPALYGDNRCEHCHGVSTYHKRREGAEFKIEKKSCTK